MSPINESVVDFSQEFLRELRIAAKGRVPFAITHEFLAALAEAARQVSAKTAMRPWIDTTLLGILANALDAWRNSVEAEARTLFAQVPDNDPIRCAISLFGTMGFGRLETAHTRTLAWLLDPKGTHGFGNSLLSKLVMHLGNRDSDIQTVDLSHLLSANVSREFSFNTPTGALRRLDVFVKTSNLALVIEAKIDHHESENQLTDIDTYLDLNYQDFMCFRVLLSVDGRAPESTVGSDRWIQLSYHELAGIFSSAMQNLNGDGLQFLRFYLAGVLHDVCGFSPIASIQTGNPYFLLMYLRVATTMNKGV